MAIGYIPHGRLFGCLGTLTGDDFAGYNRHCNYFWNFLEQPRPARRAFHVVVVNLGGHFDREIGDPIVGHAPATHDGIEQADVDDFLLGQYAIGQCLAQKIVYVTIAQCLGLAQDAPKVDKRPFAVFAFDDVIS